MQQVYLLLRHNKQTGPFRFDELMQQGLQSTDLVWVDGRSHAWLYPSEIPELRPLLARNARAASRRKGRSDAIEERAEALRQQALSFHPRYLPNLQPMTPPAETDSLRAQRMEDIEFIDHRRRRSASVEILSVVLVGCLLAGGLYGSRSLILHKEAKTVATPLSEGRTVAAPPPAPKTTLSPSLTDSTRTAADSSLPLTVDSTVQPLRPTPRPQPQKAVPQPREDSATLALVPREIVEKPQKVEKEEAKPAPPVAEAVKDTAAPPVEKVEKEEKKGFFRKLFGRKKKEKEAREE
jgi:hypothetical protein